MRGWWAKPGLAAALALAAVFASGPAAAAVTLPAGTVAQVDQTPITEAELDHARAFIFALRGRAAQPGTAAYTSATVAALGLRLDVLWISGEAAEHGVVVSHRAVSHELKRTKRRHFSSEKGFRSFLRSLRWTRRDARERVRVTLLSRKIVARVEVGCANKQQGRAALAAFLDAYRLKWRARTTCRADLVTERCSDGPLPQPQASGPAPC